MRRRSRKNTFVGVLVTSGLAALFALVLIKTLLDVRMAYRAADWPTASGRVESSTIASGCGKGASYRPVVRYRYSVGGSSYMGGRLVFGTNGCGSRSSAKELADQYPTGSPVTVYYDPDSADNAVLIVGRVLGRTWVTVVFSSIMCVVSTVLARLAYAAWRRGRIIG